MDGRGWNQKGDRERKQRGLGHAIATELIFLFGGEFVKDGGETGAELRSASRSR